MFNYIFHWRSLSSPRSPVHSPSGLLVPIRPFGVSTHEKTIAAQPLNLFSFKATARALTLLIHSRLLDSHPIDFDGFGDTSPTSIAVSHHT